MLVGPCAFGARGVSESYIVLIVKGPLLQGAIVLSNVNLRLLLLCTNVVDFLFQDAKSRLYEQKQTPTLRRL